MKMAAPKTPGSVAKQIKQHQNSFPPAELPEQ